MASKRVESSTITGATVYSRIQKISDGTYFREDTGAFAALSETMSIASHVEQTELGKYVWTGGAAVAWDDGTYSVKSYAQAGGSPDYDDICVGTGEMTISTDAEVGVGDITTNNDKTGYSISGVKTTLDALNDITAASVWAVATRTLTSFGTLIADIWASVTRTLTAGTKDAEIDAIKLVTDALPDAGALTTINNYVVDTNRIVKNKLTIDEATSKLQLWNDAGTAILYEWSLTDIDGSTINIGAGLPANRGVPA